MNFVKTPLRPLGASDGVTAPADQGATPVVAGRNTKVALDLAIIDVGVYPYTGSSAYDAAVATFLAFDLGSITTGQVKWMWADNGSFADFDAHDNGRPHWFASDTIPSGPLKLFFHQVPRLRAANVIHARLIMRRGRFTPSGSVYYKAVITRTGAINSTPNITDARYTNPTRTTPVPVKPIFARPVISTVSCTPNVAVDLFPPLGQTWIISDSLSDFGFDYSTPVTRKQETVIRAVVTDGDPAFELVNVSGENSTSGDILAWRELYMRGAGNYAHRPTYGRKNRNTQSGGSGRIFPHKNNLPVWES